MLMPSERPFSTIKYFHPPFKTADTVTLPTKGTRGTLPLSRWGSVSGVAGEVMWRARLHSAKRLMVYEDVSHERDDDNRPSRSIG